MKLIADSGSTKTDWAISDGRECLKVVSTQGINPVHQAPDTIRRVLTDELMPQLEGITTDEVFFYGSGVRPEEEQPVSRLISEVLGVKYVEAKSDLLGAARALCSHSEGIACILGTGANSCYYDGKLIVKNTPALGYILGDEGSGAVLGIRFLNALYKGRLPESLRQDFEQQTGLTLSEVINRVYRRPLANRFLASLSTFIHEHLHVEGVAALVIDNFEQFLRKSVAPYQRPDLSVSAIGSIAFYYRDLLQEAAEREGFTLGRVERSPLNALMAYHS